MWLPTAQNHDVYCSIHPITASVDAIACLKYSADGCTHLWKAPAPVGTTYHIQNQLKTKARPKTSFYK